MLPSMQEKTCDLPAAKDYMPLVSVRTIFTYLKAISPAEDGQAMGSLAERQRFQHHGLIEELVTRFLAGLVTEAQEIFTGAQGSRPQPDKQQQQAQIQQIIHTLYYHAPVATPGPAEQKLRGMGASMASWHRKVDHSPASPAR